MSETMAIVVSIVGTGIGITGVMGLMLCILTTNIGKQFDTNAAQMREMKAHLAWIIREGRESVADGSA